MKYTTQAAAFAAVALLAGCGGGSSGPSIDTTLARGSLFASPPNLVPIPQADGTAVAKLDPAAFKVMLDTAKPGLTQLTGTPKCAISTYYMKYGTVGGANETTDATGAIMVPSGTDAACSGPRPVVLYAHGTTTDKAFNMANLRDNAEASLVAAFYAAQGFIVVAPNYAGYDVSSLPYHPYLNAEQQANDMIDSLRAARKAFPVIGASDSGKLFITGYSQGGHVAMATQRAMQKSYASEFKVTALAGQSGPYALGLLGDATFAGSPNAGGTVFLPMLTTSFQKSYGGVYTTPSDIYESKYATGIETLLPGTLSFNDLFATGKLPQTALFAADSLPGPSSPAFAAFFGANNLIKSSYRTAYLADAAANPCNPTATGFTCTPQNGFRKAGVKNDLRTYVPAVPTMMCGGNGDPTVFFASTQATQAYFLGNGMPASALTVVDVDSTPTSAADPFAAVKVGFGQSKQQAIAAAVAAKQDPTTAVAASYHGTLVPPFCNAAARGFFQSVLAAGL
ncbi:alpha/beta hydrolase family protein [Noviherbaspirillum galbum]|uniref:Prolyl oligopeptidase family serine peptidase n=1 Tax=Noviherbaspirillum galbum TaxID=2709383 RepID=A0A6B3SMW1_9BURK|nr:alpha/beta hydrolase [Noviherbaspirillum galbum]NEX60665.1 prolyl oligopeptidase family serine peptidase [Noviherbaspirillum galbum]